MRGTHLFTILLVPFFFSAASAQVFNSGPSDRAMFTNAFDFPADVLPDLNSIGGVDGETTQLNVADEGNVQFLFDAFTGGEVNISGGSVGTLFDAFEGSEVNISGGSVGSGFDARFGSVINISGGSMGDLFDAFDGSEVNISGGFVGDDFDAFGGSQVNISGGYVGNDFEAFDSIVNISGGAVGDNFRALDGSEVNISGGSVGAGFEAETGSEVNISGGSVGGGFVAFDGSDVELVGGEFKLNGEAFSGPIIALQANDVFTGTLADGSAFIFSEFAGDSFSSGVSLTLPLEPLPQANLNPIVVTTLVDNGLLGLREGQNLTLKAGGELANNFAIVDSTLNVEAGAVGNNLKVAGGVVNISGGSVGGGFDAFDSSVVNLSSGSVGDSFDAFSGSEVNIRGGSVGDSFRAFDGSNVNLFGSGFILDGVSLNSLTLGEALTILDRDVTLSGRLADGSPFSFDLNSNITSSQDTFESSVVLTVTTTELLLGDINLDGAIDYIDIAPFITLLTVGDFQVEADLNIDGVVDFLDISPFIALLSRLY